MLFSGNNTPWDKISSFRLPMVNIVWLNIKQCVLTAAACMQPAQMRSGGSGSSVMTDTDYAEAVSSSLVLSVSHVLCLCTWSSDFVCFGVPGPGCLHDMLAGGVQFKC